MNDQGVDNSHKHLGVMISDNGQWNDHIDYIVKKTYNRLNIMRKSRTFLDRYSLQQNYISFIWDEVPTIVEIAIFCFQIHIINGLNCMHRN